MRGFDACVSAADDDYFGIAAWLVHRGR